MKRKNIQNKNGISISDSIVMSVKRKHANYRKPFSAAIAIIGFVSIIKAFLGMFHFHYSVSTVFMAAAVIGAFYLTLSIIGKRALWVYAASVIVFIVCAYRKAAKIALGFKFIYNIVYKDAYHSEIEYYKGLKSALEVTSVNTLFIFYIWLLAIIVFFFTICRPNPVLPLMVTFPVLEIGMYNGIRVPVFWGILCIAFWLALLAMSTIDVGEYSGGQSGFVRKNDLFFPKRHMKLKVTEKCGMLIIASVVAVAAVSSCFLKLTHYKRSEKIDNKRREITEALNDFSFDNLAESLSNLSNAIGLDFEYENHKLGTNDHVKYKNVTDLTVTLEHPTDNAIYLKDYAGAIYKNNEWFGLPSSAYKNGTIKDFDLYDIHPQDYPGLFSKLLDPSLEETTIWIKPSAKKSRHLYSPYGTINVGSLSYNKDLTVSDGKAKKGECSYKFINLDTNSIYDQLITVSEQNSQRNSREVYSASDIKPAALRDRIQKYCDEKGLISYDDFFPVDFGIPADPEYLLSKGDVLLAELMHNSYKDFVYENYLKVPDTAAMKEVEDAYSDIITMYDGSVSSEFETLNAIRDRMSSECTYSLYPRKTPSNRDFVNYFLLENKKGYCTHYATSGVMLARMAGIPARYATGYILVEKDIEGGHSSSDGSVTIDVKDNRSHAWAEIYVDNIGWIPYEFTAGYSAQEINTQPVTTAEPTTAEDATTTTNDPASRTTGTVSKAAATTTSTAVTTKTATSIAKGGAGSGSGHGMHIPKVLKSILLLLLALILITAFILLRRKFILSLREKRFTTGKAERKVRYMYAYAEKLLEALDMKSENGNYNSFADEVEKAYGGIYFNEGAFRKLTDTALRASFSKDTPTDKDIEESRKTIEAISDKLYKKASRFDKLRLMYINVLK